MIKHNQDGAASGVTVALILAILLLVGAVAFGGWAFSSRQDYKNNTDAKIKVAEEAARQKESIAKDIQFAEESKKPLKTYVSPESFGSMQISYPKTWSAYVEDSTAETDSTFDGYFNPGVVPSANSENSVFALRAKTINEPYAQVLEQLTNQQEEGKITVSAYALPKLPKVVGVRVVGELDDKRSVNMVVLPLRSQTLEIWTDGDQYLEDFNNIILPNFSFSP